MDLKSLIAIALPILKLVADKVSDMLRDKDSDDVGVDDELGHALKYVVERLEKYV